MKRTGKEPRLLAQVMQAIADLREGTGSTQKKIIEQITNILKKTNGKTRNLTIQVRRALKHGVDTGLIKQRSGKFRLGLDPKDYAVFKSFRSLDPLKDCMTGRRGRRRKGRRRRRGRRGRRRRSIGRRDSPDDDISDSAASESDFRKSRSMTGTPEPQDRGRRRRKGRRRRRRRRGRRRTSHKSSDSSASPAKDSSKEVTPQRKHSDENRRVEHPEREKDRRNEDHSNPHSHGHAKDDEIDCGNSECLCNIKQEVNDVHRNYSRSTHFDENYDHYIN